MPLTEGVCVCVCVRACACVRVRVRVCVRVRVRVRARGDGAQIPSRIPKSTPSHTRTLSVSGHWPA